MSDIAPATIDSDGPFCIACSYNLHGIASDRCPECGIAIDRAALATSLIPWTHRRTIGRVRGYLRTVKMSIMHCGRLAHEIARPVSFADAIRFRRVTAAVATGSIIVLTLCLICISDLNGELSSFRLEILGTLVFWICVWFFFLTAGGVASYWFHPRSMPVGQQNRAIAISYYSCGPLALTPIAVVLICTGLLCNYIGELYSHQWSVGGFDAIFAVGVSGIGLLISEFALMLMSTNRLLRRVTRCTAERSICCWIGLPISWVCLGGVFLIALPAAYVFVVLMSLSFH